MNDAKPVCKVRFNATDEFLNELRDTARSLGRDLGEPAIRLTKQFRESKPSPSIREVSVICGFLACTGDRCLLVELERYCGEMWVGVKGGEDALTRADAVMAEIEQRAKDLALEVRVGQYVL